MELTLEEREQLKAAVRNPVFWGAIQAVLAERAAHALAVQDEEALQENPSLVRIAALTAERKAYQSIAGEIELEALRID